VLNLHHCPGKVRNGAEWTKRKRKGGRDRKLGVTSRMATSLATQRRLTLEANDNVAGKDNVRTTLKSTNKGKTKKKQENRKKGEDKQT